MAVFANMHDRPHPDDEVVFWFAALEESDNIRETYNRKDLAHLILKGIAPLTKESITEWVQSYNDDADDEGVMIDWIEHFRRFYDVKEPS